MRPVLPDAELHSVWNVGSRMFCPTLCFTVYFHWILHCISCCFQGVVILPNAELCWSCVVVCAVLGCFAPVFFTGWNSTGVLSIYYFLLFPSYRNLAECRVAFGLCSCVHGSGMFSPCFILRFFTWVHIVPSSFPRFYHCAERRLGFGLCCVARGSGIFCPVFGCGILIDRSINSMSFCHTNTMVVL